MENHFSMPERFAIKVPFEVLDRKYFGEAFETVVEILSDPHKEWLSEHDIAYEYDLKITDMFAFYLEFYFTNVNDAIHFKLRWVG
jgi:hypothetical protein